MRIITKAIFYDDEKKEDKEVEYSFDLNDICNDNEGENGYTVITDRSTGTRTNIKIKYSTYKKLLYKNYFTIIEIFE